MEKYLPLFTLILGIIIILIGLLNIRAKRVHVFMLQNQWTFQQNLREKRVPDSFKQLMAFIDNSPGFWEILLSRKRITLDNFYSPQQQQQYFK